MGLVEVVDNAKWADPHNPSRAAVAEKLRKGLIAPGCEPGWAYCITGARLVRQEAYADASPWSERSCSCNTLEMASARPKATR